jgi:hypothetical protein
VKYIFLLLLTVISACGEDEEFELKNKAYCGDFQDFNEYAMVNLACTIEELSD